MKKFISLFLTFAVLCASFNVYATNEAKTTDHVFADAEVSPLDSNEYHALFAMDFLSDDLSGKDKSTLISRAQFVGILAKLSGNVALKYNRKLIPFIDVNTLNPYCDEICAMYEMGYVTGTGDNMFNPDGSITYSIAAKIIVKVLGYEMYSTIKYGNTPGGYVMTAVELKLDDGLGGVTANTQLTLNNAVTLLYNTACTEIMEFTGIDKNSDPIYKKRGATFLKRNDIYQARGVVQNNGFCSLIDGGVREGEFVIDGERFASADDALIDLLGYTVRYYYKNDDTGKKLLWAYPDKRYNNVIKLNAIELDINSPEYTETNFVYFNENNKTTSIKVNAFADVIYNYSYYAVPTLEILKPKTGTMRLIDNNDDDCYDIVIIEEFYNVFVKTIAPTSQQIVDKYNRTINLTDYDVVKIIKDGKEISFQDIGAEVLLSCVEDKDKEKIFIYVMSKVGEGVLNGKSVEGDYEIYQFGDVTYRIAYDLERKIDNSNFVISDAQLGKKYKYYIDMAGEIGEFKLTDTEKQYGFLMRAEKGKALESDIIYTRILLSDGSKITGITKKKLIIDGERRPASEMMSNPAITDENGEFKPQVVMVAFDDDGYLREIDFATDNTSNPYGYDVNEFSLDRSKEVVVKLNGFALIDYKYTVSSKTIVFVKWTNFDIDEPYTVTISSVIKGGNQKLQIYDSDEKLIPAVVYKEQNAREYWIDGRMLVDKIAYVSDDGQTVKCVSGYYANEYRRIIEYAPGVFPGDLKRGDLLKISYYNSRATGAYKEMTTDDFLGESPRLFSGDGLDSYNVLVYAPIYNVSSNGVTLLCPEAWEGKYGKVFTAPIRSGNKLLVLIYDKKYDRIIQGDWTDICQVVSPKGDGTLPNENDRVMAYVKIDYCQLKEIVLVIN